MHGELRTVSASYGTLVSDSWPNTSISSTHAKQHGCDWSTITTLQRTATPWSSELDNTSVLATLDFRPCFRSNVHHLLHSRRSSRDPASDLRAGLNISEYLAYNRVQNRAMFGVTNRTSRNTYDDCRPTLFRLQLVVCTAHLYARTTRGTRQCGMEQRSHECEPG